jgi:hypothetical protein
MSRPAVTSVSAGTRFWSIALVLLFAALAPAAANAQSIKPGMSEAEVIAAWGKPLVSRTHGDYTYMYFENGCVKTCGTYDVVFFEKGQVVDAIVRADNHVYDGVSSSPKDRKPGFTKPD